MIAVVDGDDVVVVAGVGCLCVAGVGALMAVVRVPLAVVRYVPAPHAPHSKHFAPFRGRVLIN